MWKTTWKTIVQDLLGPGVIFLTIEKIFAQFFEKYHRLLLKLAPQENPNLRKLLEIPALNLRQHHRTLHMECPHIPTPSPTPPDKAPCDTSVTFGSRLLQDHMIECSADLAGLPPACNNLDASKVLFVTLPFLVPFNVYNLGLPQFVEAVGDDNERHSSITFDVTLVTYFKQNEVQQFLQLLAFWNGPVSASVYVQENEISQLMEQLKFNETLADRRNVGIHAVFADKQALFPTNFLQNFALAQVPKTSSHVLLLPVKAIPQPELYEKIRRSVQHIKQQKRYLKPARTALVVPAFEPLDKSKMARPPATKGGVVKAWQDGLVAPLGVTSKHPGSDAIHYLQWGEANTFYPIEPKRGFAPFLCLQLPVPWGDVKFVDEPHFRPLYTADLAARGYTFVVDPNNFVFSPDSASRRHMQAHINSVCMASLEDSFYEQISRR
eukprot:m.120143 g.120143  ORF g.120143 m.120143 type:complete len:437 (+) comp23216_c0_seq3:769-2079(+)